MTLTPRESEALQALADGAVQKTLPEQMGICASVVEHHLRRARLRLGARSTPHAVALALRQGLIK